MSPYVEWNTAVYERIKSHPDILDLHRQLAGVFGFHPEANARKLDYSRPPRAEVIQIADLLLRELLVGRNEPLDEDRALQIAQTSLFGQVRRQIQGFNRELETCDEGARRYRSWRRKVEKMGLKATDETLAEVLRKPLAEILEARHAWQLQKLRPVSWVDVLVIDTDPRAEDEERDVTYVRTGHVTRKSPVHDDE